jgi:hypothetical protein
MYFIAILLIVALPGFVWLRECAETASSDRFALGAPRILLVV